MPRDRNVNWTGWGRYYAGRTLELLGLFLVTAAIVLFFGTPEMRPMLAVTGAGAALFVLGWLAARKHPSKDRPPARRSQTKGSRR